MDPRAWRDAVPTTMGQAAVPGFEPPRWVMITAATGVGAVAGGVMGARRKRSGPATAAWIGATSGAGTWVHTEIKARICAANPAINAVQASFVSGGVAGTLFGAIIARNVFATTTCGVAGLLAATSAELVQVQWSKYRLGKLLEERMPELAPVAADAIATHDLIVAGERPWYWPEWVPVQPTDAVTEEKANANRIRMLKMELARLYATTDEAAEAAVAAGLKPASN